MKTIVVYASKYGSTETYARWIAEALHADLYAVKALSSETLSRYDCILYGGGLYAGGVKGLSTFLKKYASILPKTFILFTCGIADPNDPANVQHIRNSLKKIFPPDLEAQTAFFPLRGRLNYRKLSVMHRAMMAMLQPMLAKKDPATLRVEDQQLLDTYGNDVNFIDRSTIQPILSFVQDGINAK